MSGGRMVEEPRCRSRPQSPGKQVETGASRGWELPRITPMALEDLQEVLSIEMESQPEPWSEKGFKEELLRSPVMAFVAKVSNEELEASEGTGSSRIPPHCLEKGWHICGYVCFWVVADELQIVNVAVRKDFRRRGIGMGLLLHALRMGASAGARRSFLEVRKSNTAALELYKRVGFLQVGERPGYYGPNKEAAVLMERVLDSNELDINWPDQDAWTISPLERFNGGGGSGPL